MHRIPRSRAALAALCFCAALSVAFALPPPPQAPSVPTEVQQPGTQPLEVQPLLPSSACTNCHAGFDPVSEPGHGWMGSAMSLAGRDPLFWAAVAVAESDFDGSGDLCLRCHAPAGWLDGHSTPTDGSALLYDDFDGVGCHVCHRMTNPDDSEHVGVQNPPFVANDGAMQPVAYLGGAMLVINQDDTRLGPYSDTYTAQHTWAQSQFHRSSNLCSSCHDVSNPLVGDLAPGHGSMSPLAAGTFSGVPGTPVDGKAAFNNFPQAYGIVERTASEHLASPFPTLPVGDYVELPGELKAGALRAAWLAATAATPSGNYVDGSVRNFTCQSCHMPPVKGAGASAGLPIVRDDLPRHDLTGANTWVGDAIEYLDAQNRLVGGNGLLPAQLAAIADGQLRAFEHLRQAATLRITGATARIVNLTGHKLISGYPEGRRMWLHSTWRDVNGLVLREDGRYGDMAVTHNNQPLVVQSLIDLADPYAYVVEAHNAISQAWAAKLLAMGTAPGLPLSFDRHDGAVQMTLGQLAVQPAGTQHESMHFVLNDALVSDNRIPPYGLDYDAALARNALPVPATQFGNPGPGGTFEHWADVQLAPPPGAVVARLELLYQTASWEYVQFLELAGSNAPAFLATTGADLVEAWLATGMSQPVVMAVADWGSAAPQVYCTSKVNSAGCLPAISSSGAPSASAPQSFDVYLTNSLNRMNGLLFYSTRGAASLPVQGGTLCVKPPVVRSTGQNSGGTPLPAADCSGSFSFDMRALIQSGAPGLFPGVQVWCQWWSRDVGFQAPDNTNLSDALTFVIGN